MAARKNPTSAPEPRKREEIAGRVPITRDDLRPAEQKRYDQITREIARDQRKKGTPK